MKDLSSLREKYLEITTALIKESHVRALPNPLTKKFSVDGHILFELFMNSLMTNKGVDKFLHIKLYDEFMIDEILFKETAHSQIDLREQGLFNKIEDKRSWDLLFCNFRWHYRIHGSEDPSGYYRKYRLKNKQDAVPVDFGIIKSLEYLQLISRAGLGVCFLPSYFRVFQISRFREILEESNLYVEAVIKLPKWAFVGRTSLRPILVVVSRQKREKEFYLELEYVEDIENKLDGFFNGIDSENIFSGIWLKHTEFFGFEAWHYDKKISLLGGDFTNYSKTSLKDVVLSINVSRTGRTEESFIKKQNAVYLPLIGNKHAVTNIEDLASKHQHYAQIIADTDKVLPEYLASFFNSELGKNLIQKEQRKQGINTMIMMRPKYLMGIDIAVPALDIQKSISQNIKKMKLAKKKIEEYSNNISINPVSDSESLKKIDSILEAVYALSDPDRVRAIIRGEENTTTEFKETFRLDIKTKEPKTFITESTMKTLCAFFNTNGGDLLIGVHDSKKITGIDKEMKQLHKGKRDNFKKTFQDIFKSYIGPEFYPLIDYKMVEIDSKTVFWVSCKQSDRAVFMNEEDFYMRADPATHKLTGRAQSDYIHRRFPEGW